MSHEIKPEYSQQLLFPINLEDWIPAEHPARFFREFVDGVDLRKLGFAEREAERGRPNYSANLLLKAWLYGLFLRVRSTRQLELMCRDHVGMIWLLTREVPDHNTLHRFFQGHRKALRALFRETVRQAMGMGLVGLVVQALDGTKIEAVSSRRKAWHKNEQEALLRRVEQGLDEALAAVEEAEKQHTGEVTLPPEYQEKQVLAAEIRRRLSQMEEVQRDHLHPGEPDARMMKTGQGVRLGYNAQVVVDERAGVIVAEDVVNEESDSGQLMPMLDQVAEVLGEVAETTVADGGYASGEQLAQAEQAGRDVVVPLPVLDSTTGRFDRLCFQKDPQEDAWICPLGKRLEFIRVRGPGEKNGGASLYRCRSYKECPERAACSQDKKGRTLEISPHQETLERHRRKRTDPACRERYRKRQGIVEPVFGWLKTGHGFRRWTRKGLEGVRGQWSILCSVLNLTRMYKVWLQEKTPQPV